MSSSDRKASSGSDGFFQEAPRLEHPFRDDWVFQRIYHAHLPSIAKQEISSDLDRFGSLITSPHIYTLIADAERNPPSISTHTTFGKPQSVLHTGRGWRELQALGISEGIVAIPYEANHGHYSRVYQFLKNHLWTGSAAMVTCPSAMTDGAARLLSRHQDGKGMSSEQTKFFRQAYANVTSRDSAKAWTSGQWMTERTGGSHVRGTETVAVPLDVVDEKLTDTNGLPLGPYSISGFKWFSSATDSNMAVMLAQAPQGLSAFVAPMRRSRTGANVSGTLDDYNSELNGITIQRLKPKMGTKPVPTAELILDGTRGWLVGAEGNGVREISTLLNITRVYTGIGSLGYWGRGLAIARSFVRVRTVDGDKPLASMPACLAQMAKNTINYSAMMHLGFLVVELLGISEQPEAFQSGKFGIANNLVKDLPEAIALVRLLTAVMKAQCSKMAVSGLQECMETLGGVGYLEDEQQYNVARLFRDCNVQPIWEGTTDVMAWDVARVIKGRDGGKVQSAFFAWARRHMKQWPSSQWSHAAKRMALELDGLEDMFATLEGDELKFRGREVLARLAWIVATVSLIADAENDGNEAAIAIAKRWAHGDGSYPEGRPSWKEETRLNKLIALPNDGPEQSRL